MLSTRVLGGDLEVSAIGLGCVGMSAEYGKSSEWNQSESLATLERAFELGVTLFDTADSYGPQTNELLLGKFLRHTRQSVIISTKSGLVFDSNAQRYVVNGRPDHIKEACAASLQRLGTDHIDIYYLHRIDPDVPLEDSWGAMHELLNEGKVRALGVCEASVEQLDVLHKIAPLSAVQSEFSLWTRGALVDVLPWCMTNGIGFVPFSPLGRGFLTGTIGSADFAEGDIRALNPRFSSSAIAANQAIVKGIKQVADTHGATTAQIAIAWIMAQGEAVVPIPGTKRIKYLEENVGAAAVSLSTEDLAALSALPEPVGSRY